MIAQSKTNSQFYDDEAPAALAYDTYCAPKAPVDRPQMPPDTTHAAPLGVWSKAYGVPLSTLYQLLREGRGPRTFKVRRRIFARRADWHQWLDDLAADDVRKRP
jgi:hypothetical protein